MIEVLVSITLVAFALFALIGMQTTALRHQQMAHLRSIANQFSADLAERVRANIQGAHRGAYNVSPQRYPALASRAPACATSGECAPHELAAKDLHEWRVGLSRAMPGGWGDIAGSVADGFTIRVYFRDATITSGDDSNLTDENCKTSVVNVDPHKDVRCLSMVFFP